MDKKNIIIIILAIAILGVCIGIGVVSVDKKTDATPVEPDTTDPNYKVFNEIDTSECSHKQCDKTYTFNNNSLRIVTTEELKYQVLYNKKVIISNQELPFFGDKVYTYDKKLVYFLNNEDGTFTVNVYDPDNTDFQMFTLDEKDFNWNIESVSFNQNKITFITSRFISENRFVDESGSFATPINSCENFTKYKDKEASKTFVISYIDGQFSPAVVSQTILLKDYKDYYTLCN